LLKWRPLRGTCVSWLPLSAEKMKAVSFSPTHALLHIFAFAQMEATSWNVRFVVATLRGENESSFIFSHSRTPPYSKTLETLALFAKFSKNVIFFVLISTSINVGKKR